MSKVEQYITSIPDFPKEGIIRRVDKGVFGKALGFFLLVEDSEQNGCNISRNDLPIVLEELLPELEKAIPVKMQTALGLMRERNNDFALSDMAKEGFGGVICVEAGGPTPGLGCAGRGIIAALENLEEKGAYAAFCPDVVFYDVLGDVVCGGFSMPMRAGYADRVFIVTSGENMALHAAANIAMAVENFRGRGYASLGGLILNRRNVKNEEEKVRELAGDISSQIVGSLDFSETVQQAEALSKTVIEAFPESEMAAEYRALADAVLRACEVAPC